MNEAAMQVQMEELQAYHNKLEEQARTRQFLGQVNEQLKYFQDLEREEKRQAELKVIFKKQFQCSIYFRSSICFN